MTDAEIVAHLTATTPEDVKVVLGRIITQVGERTFMDLAELITFLIGVGVSLEDLVTTFAYSYERTALIAQMMRDRAS